MIISLPSLPPSVNRARTIHKRGNKRFIGSTDEYRDWIREAAWQVVAQRRTLRFETCRVEITVTRPDKRRRDLDNLIKATLDALVKGGALADDSGVVDLRIFWIEEGAPGMCIAVTGKVDLREAA